MKTLDEVIKALECCIDPELHCNTDCPYEDRCEGQEYMNIDALYYLREYRKQMTDPDGDHQQLEKARTLLQDFYRNDPLTWEELTQMEGKPVWVECAGSFWAVIVCVEENRFWYRCRWAGHDYCDREYMGEHWQAYRQEREA